MSQKGLVDQLKRMRWDLKDELDAWWMFLLRTIPGSAGVLLRRILLTRRFGACGRSPVILEGLKVDNPGALFIGNNFRSNRNCYINAGGTVRIGHDVLLGPDVKIWSVNHKFEDASMPIEKQGYNYSEVIIENNVWIAANVFIAPGVRVGMRSVLAAGTVLTKSVPPGSIVMGNPGRVLRTLDGIERDGIDGGRKED